MDSASLIKEARARAGMTQAQLAAAAGTSQPTIAAYETDAKSPSVRTLERLVRSAGSVLEVHLREAPTGQESLLSQLRKDAAYIRRLARKRHIRNVRVFGSTARGEETASSDVDLLVDFDVRRFGVLPLAGFAHEVGILMGRHVDVTTTHLLKDHIRTRALAEAVPL